MAAPQPARVLQRWLERIQTLVALLSGGFILFFFSETLFWGRPGRASPAELSLTWLAYTVLAAALLWALETYRARGGAAFFLGAALYGWLAEGVLAGTLYTGLPLSLSWTGLAWHALLSVGLGWSGLSRALRSGAWATLGAATLWGVFWALWATVWWTGMVWSGFRPSDDAYTYGYLIPANMFAVVVLGQLAQMAQEVLGDADLAEFATILRDEIEQGIQAHGIVNHPAHGPIYAYETDGLGHHLLMDDANVPSLLSIPYLGYRPADDPLYLRTRRFILSPDNPYYFSGQHAAGVGSPHTPGKLIWPIALAMQGLTSSDQAERRRLLDMLTTTTAGTSYMHESFHPDDPAQFTRPWFAWANSLFAEFVLAFVQPERAGSPQAEILIRNSSLSS